MPANNVCFQKNKTKNNSSFSVYQEAARGKEHNWTGGLGEGCDRWQSKNNRRATIVHVCGEKGVETQNQAPGASKGQKAAVRCAPVLCWSRYTSNTMTTGHGERLGRENVYLTQTSGNHGPGALCGLLIVIKQCYFISISSVFKSH